MLPTKNSCCALVFGAWLATVAVGAGHGWVGPIDFCGAGDVMGPSGYQYAYGYDPEYNYQGTVGSPNEVTPSVVSAVQAELSKQGYYHGGVDGMLGARTSEAIRAYQEDNGLPADGQITPALLSSMKISLPAG
jgi:hypothetical protein